MRTKDEIADDINDKLGTEIDWSQLRKDDLKHFEEMIESGVLIEALGKSFVKEKSSEKVEETIEDWEPGQIVAKLI